MWKLSGKAESSILKAMFLMERAEQEPFQMVSSIQAIRIRVDISQRC